MEPLLACDHRDWSGLPRNILLSIKDRLKLDDYVRFGAVCIPWRSVFVEEISRERLLYSLCAGLMDDLSVSESFSSSGIRTKPLLARDWSGLPRNILLSIMDRLKIDDYVRFGAVCIPWRSVFVEEISRERPSCSRLPFLLIVTPPPEAGHHHRLLYSLSNKRVYNFRLQLPHKKVCRGSSFGWLVTSETNNRFNCQVQLQNPFLNRILDLPPLDNILQKQPDTNIYGPENGYGLYKAVLSSDPCYSPDHFVVMAIVGRYRGLAFFRPGNTTWTTISIGGRHADWKERKLFVDVIFFHKTNQFYALLADATVLAVDFLGDEGNPKLTQVVPPPPRQNCGAPVYLVEDFSSGDLFLVFRKKRSNIAFQGMILNGEPTEAQSSATINVFKLDTTSGMWSRIDNLGENIMFLGSNGSIIRSISDCPGCEPNCIYYTDAKFCCFRFERYEPPSYRIYNLKDGMIRQQYSSARSKILRRLVRPAHSAIWLEPTIKRCN